MQQADGLVMSCSVMYVVAFKQPDLGPGCWKTS